MTVEQLKARMTGWLQSKYNGYLGWIGDHVVAYCLYRDDSQYYFTYGIYL